MSLELEEKKKTKPPKQFFTVFGKKLSVKKYHRKIGHKPKLLGAFISNFVFIMLLIFLLMMIIG